MKKTGASCELRSTAASKPNASQMMYAVASGSTVAVKSPALRMPKAKSAAAKSPASGSSARAKSDGLRGSMWRAVLSSP